MKHTLPLILLLACTTGVAAHAQQALPLYVGSIPNAINAPDEEKVRDPSEASVFLLDVSRPQLIPFLPAVPDASRTAIIILPGGSYRGVSIQKEGLDVAKQLKEFGIAAFVLKYRMPDERHMKDRTLGPQQDVQEAIHTVRSRAADWNVDPQHVGVMGFSAGGHLASTAGTHYDEPVIARADKISLRPDFLVLVYPVINLSDALAHRMSRELLLGPAPSKQLMTAYSNDLRVTADTPPTMLVHAADDASVVVANSLRFFEALQANKVPAELIVFPAGGHGFGLINATTPDRWIERCRDWLISQHLLTASK